MLDLWHAATSATVLPATIVLALCLVYWIFVILGAVGLDTFDIDLDADADVDVDLDGDFDAAGPGSILSGILEFLYLGEVPVMIVLSFFSLSFWMIAMMTVMYSPFSGLITGLLIYLPGLLITALATKILLAPIAAFFRKINREEDSVKSVIGQIAELNSDSDGTRIVMGQVRTSGAPFLVNLKTRGAFLPKGSHVLIIERDAEHDLYYAEKFDDWES